MACKVIKKLLGYELCCLEPEGTLFFADHITLIRKAEYTELFNLETMDHKSSILRQWIMKSEIL